MDEQVEENDVKLPGAWEICSKVIGSCAPMLALSVFIGFMMGWHVIKWVLFELLTYGPLEWIALLGLAILPPQLLPKRLLALPFVAIAIAIFVFDVIRISVNLARDIDFVFYFGFFARVIFALGLSLPLATASYQFRPHLRRWASERGLWPGNPKDIK